jgi:RNA polymerase sigma-70 factor (ECF subfamily)
VEDEIEMMARIGRGDRAAFEELYRRYRSPLGRFLYRLCWDAPLCEELLQEVFLGVWRAAARFEGRSRVSTYLYTLARNAWLNAAERRTHRREAEAAVGQARPEGVEPTGGEDAERARAALSGLPVEEREALVLAYYQALPYPEIARIQGVPVGTIKSRVHRALARLRERLGGATP